MSILFTNEIITAVTNELKQATTSVQIITAYCKESSLAYLNKCVNTEVKDKRILIRFRLDDILKGSTDFGVIRYGMDAGWKVYIRFDLHAKTYIVDQKRGFVGSANITDSGLSIGRAGNVEMATLIDIEYKDVEKINKLFNDAIFVNDDILLKMQQQMDEAVVNGKKEGQSWDSSITLMFEPHIDTLFSHELPEEFLLVEGEYFSFIDEVYRGDIKKFKESFRWSNVYLWLLSVLRDNNGCLYFGSITEKLHSALISDPKPYRRDVKQMLTNLLKLVEVLDMEEVVIDRPNYSQRVRLADKGEN